MGTSVVGCVFPELPVCVWMERNVMLDRSTQLTQNAETLIGSGSEQFGQRRSKVMKSWVSCFLDRVLILYASQFGQRSARMMK